MTKGKNNAAFFAHYQKRIYISVIIVMCLLICWCFKSAVDYRVLRNTFAACNTIIDIVLMAFVTMLFGFSANNKYTVTTQNLVFSLLIITEFVMLFFSTLGYAAYGLPYKADMIRVCESISYMVYFASFAVLWKYQLFFYKKTRVVKCSTWIIYLMVLLYAILSAANFFAPVLFHIDANGFYDTPCMEKRSTSRVTTV